MSACFAYNVQRQRCSLEAGHEDDHEIRTTWTDDECFDPNDLPVPFTTPTSGGQIVTMNAGPPVPAFDTGKNPLAGNMEKEPDGTCYSCGCDEDAHAEGACEKHGCRTFIA